MNSQSQLQSQNLLSIGNFAGAARLSLKALRLYDQLDILKPSYVDPHSGYRYYQVSQLRQARLVRMMRQMEMPLATIGKILTAAPAEAEQYIDEYRQTREQQIEQMKKMIPNLITYLRQEVTLMSFEVNIKTIPAQPILSMTHRIKVENISPQIRESLQQLYQLAEAQSIPVTGAPFGIYHGPINHDDDGPIEVCLPVQYLPDSTATPTTPTTSTTADATSRELPGGKGATVMLKDDQCQFPALLAGYDALIDWIRQNHYEPTQPPREIWHSQKTDWEVIWLFQ